MFEQILAQMHEKIHAMEYVMTLHAADEMDDDLLTIVDVENAILTGEIVERQTDANTGEWKYCIVGETERGDDLEVIVKFGANGKLVIITVFSL